VEPLFRLKEAGCSFPLPVKKWLARVQERICSSQPEALGI
jgi:hypothetical protein